MSVGKRLDWLNALSIAGFLAALYVLYELVRRANWSTLAIPDLATLIGAVVIGATALVLAGISLAATVVATGPAPKPLIAPSVSAANRTVLTKYLPGKIWYVVGISESLVEAGLRRPRAWAVVLVYQTVVIGTALLVGLIAATDLGLWELLIERVGFELGPWHAILLVAVVAFLGTGGLWILRRARTAVVRNLSMGAAVAGVLVALAHWLLQGISIWIILSECYGEWLDLATIVVVPAVYALGFLVLIAPGGIGVRELLFTQYFLYLGLPVHTAASLAIIARLAALAIEIGVWAILYVASRTRLWSGKSVSRRAQ